MKTAILQVADTGPLESLVVMLRSIGYQCWLPDEGLKSKLRSIGCDTVLDIDSLVRGMGYEQPIKLPYANIKMMDKVDLYVDIKAHRNGPKVWASWPRLSTRTLWYRINGGKPEHVITNKGIDHGDEVNPPCPVLTPNQWYKDNTIESTLEPGDEWVNYIVSPWSNKSYTCWPPFYRFKDYYETNSRINQESIPISSGLQRFLMLKGMTVTPTTTHVSLDSDIPTILSPPDIISVRESTDAPSRIYYNYSSPVCLIHGINGWGYHALVDSMRGLGIKCYGQGAPDGLLNHTEIPKLLSTAKCMVHLKSNDAPGYSLLESLAAGCPIVLTRRLIWRCKMQELFIPDETCLVFDRETHDGLTPKDIEECTAEVKYNLDRLSDPVENQRIGMAGYNRLKEVMWSEHITSNVDSIREFMERMFP